MAELIIHLPIWRLYWAGEPSAWVRMFVRQKVLQNFKKYSPRRPAMSETLCIHSHDSMYVCVLKGVSVMSRYPKFTLCLHVKETVFCSMNEWMSEWTNRQAPFSKPRPNWNQQTPTGPQQPCLMSRKSVALKPQKGYPLRRQIQYTCRLQTVVRLSLQGPAPPRIRQGGAIQHPLMSPLPGAQNLVYAQPQAMAQKKMIRDIITEWRMTLVKQWQLTT